MNPRSEIGGLEAGRKVSLQASIMTRLRFETEPMFAGSVQVPTLGYVASLNRSNWWVKQQNGVYAVPIRYAACEPCRGELHPRKGRSERIEHVESVCH